MSARNTAIHIFDVDRTITRHSTGRRFAEYGHTQGLFSLLDLLRFPMFYIRYRFGFVSPQQMASQSLPVAGMSQAELEEHATTCFTSRILPDLYEEVEPMVADLRRNGSRVALATTTLALLVRPLARHLGIDTVISTELEFVAGVATGRIVGLPCFREEKKRRVLSHLASLKLQPKDAWFYTDSHSDIPLLRAVGHPVAVNPERRLARTARKEGWPVRYFG